MGWVGWGLSVLIGVELLTVIIQLINAAAKPSPYGNKSNNNNNNNKLPASAFVPNNNTWKEG
jgi:hypothetical protein